MSDDKKRLDPADFWDISDLIPQKKPPKVPTPARTIEAVEVTSPSPERLQNTADVPLTEHFVPPHTAAEVYGKEKADESYIPTDSLLHEVRIYRWKNQYLYYEDFCRHALFFYKKEGSPSPAVEFFSYMPQYSQMNEGQLNYYLWWRKKFREGKCLEAGYSYLLLYLYEIINLEGVMKPEEGQTLMLRLWLSYRDKFPRLDALVREWLCDYSLLHRLPPPRLPPLLFNELVSGCRLKEFYVSAQGADTLTDAVLYFCSNYDYQKSKFYKEESKEIFNRVLRGAVAVFLQYQKEKGSEPLPGCRGYSTIGRDAFSGAICSYRKKRRIEVDFDSFSHTHELRYLVTDVLKYAENAVRAFLGVKSRLGVYALPEEIKEKLNLYLAEALPKKECRKQVSSPAVPEYERRYDLKENELSYAHASEIEKESWQTTQRLVESFADETAAEIPFSAAEKEETESLPAMREEPQADNRNNSSLKAALGDFLPFLSLALNRNYAGQRQFAEEKGLMLDALADRINTVACDSFGDIILQEEGGGYAVLEDYLEDLKTEGVFS